MSVVFHWVAGYGVGQAVTVIFVFGKSRDVCKSPFPESLAQRQRNPVVNRKVVGVVYRVVWQVCVGIVVPWQSVVNILMSQE